MKLYYFLVNGYEPLIADDIDYVKKLKNTDDVKIINKSQFEELASAYIVYNTFVENILHRKGK